MTELRCDIAEPRLAAVRAIGDILARQQVTHAFVGEVAIGAWTGVRVDRGAVDVLALVAPDSRQQIPMMASHRGFTVDAAEVEATRELDLIPMRYGEGSDAPRVHVLLASNALYSKMLGRAVPASAGGAEIPVVHAEDLAIMLSLSDRVDVGAIDLAACAGEAFDVDRFNTTLRSIGLGGKVIAR
ncbi:MAG: hypothetical protein NDJ92_15845 [Thermoanaerobaculia bacterium]|nr:hypothetical protein [Thermoanaerobaculia bacterium]